MTSMATGFAVTAALLAAVGTAEAADTVVKGTAKIVIPITLSPLIADGNRVSVSVTTSASTTGNSSYNSTSVSFVKAGGSETVTVDVPFALLAGPTTQFVVTVAASSFQNNVYRSGSTTRYLPVPASGKTTTIRIGTGI